MIRKKTARRKPVAEINVVPYIDVMLVLLVIFMVTAPLLMQGVEVALPQSPSKPINTKDDEPIIVSVKTDQTLYINLGGTPEQAVSLEIIKNQVAKVLRNKPQTPVLVWADKSVDYGTVVHVMSELQAAGVSGVGLVTEPPSAAR